MKPGFTLIEIILATALASMISVALIFMTRQMSGTLMRVDRISDLHIRATMLQNQMERDIAGAFAPTDFSATSTTGDTQSESSRESLKDKPKKIEKIFWGDKTLETLSFITNNPLQTYWGKRSGKAQPKIVRVVYRLVADAKRKDVYTLMRQEGSDLNFESYTLGDNKIHTYAMIEGIKSIDIDYTVLIKKEPTKQETTPGSPVSGTPGTNTTEKQTPAAEEFERKTVQEWKTIDDQKPPWPLIPQFVTMRVTLWDDTFKRTTPFTFEFQIIPRFEKADQKEEEEQKPETPKTGISSLFPAIGTRK